MNRNAFLTLASSIYCSCLLISNIVAAKTFEIIGITLPCAVIVFPIIYILNDVLTECYGFTVARRIVFTGFAINLLAVLIYEISIILPASTFYENQEAFKMILGSTPRVLAASLAAYLCGSLLNAKVMEKMKGWREESLMLRCVGSTLVGETVDACIFITVSFVGSMPFTSLVVMILAQAIFKTAYETIVYPVTKQVIKKVKSLSD